MRNRQTGLDDDVIGQLLCEACALFGDPAYAELSDHERSYWRNAAADFSNALLDHLAAQADSDDALGRFCYELHTMTSVDWSKVGEPARSSWIKTARAVRLRVEAARRAEVSGLRRALLDAIQAFDGVLAAVTSGADGRVLAATARHAAEEARRAHNSLSISPDES